MIYSGNYEFENYTENVEEENSTTEDGNINTPQDASLPVVIALIAVPLSGAVVSSASGKIRKKRKMGK